jgi:uncharacterized protein (DUF2225 family)
MQDNHGEDSKCVDNNDMVNYLSEAMDCMGSKREVRRKSEHLIQNEEGDRKTSKVGAARGNG